MQTDIRPFPQIQPSKKSRWVWCSLAAMVCSLAAPGNAAIITYSASAPTANIAQSLPTINPYPQNVLTAGVPGHQLGFTFTASSNYTLDKVTLFLQKTQLTFASTDVAAITVFTMTATQTAPADGTSPLSTATDTGLALPAAMNPARSMEGYLTFDITNVALVVGQKYGVLFNITSTTGYASFHLAADGAPGNAFRDDGTSWLRYTGNLSYYLQSPAPEPSVGLLLFLGAALVGRRFRSRRGRKG
ncbi:MAG: hypothetical protein WC708_07060 [Lentisphaeria bacterium]